MNRFRNVPLVLTLMLLLAAAQLNLSAGNCCCDASAKAPAEAAMSCHESETTDESANHCPPSQAITVETEASDCNNCESGSDLETTVITDLNCAGSCHNLEGNAALFIQPDLKPVISFLKTADTNSIDKQTYLAAFFSCQVIDVNPPPRYLLFQVFLN